MKRIFHFIAGCIFSLTCCNASAQAPKLLLAERYDDSVSIENYWVSEKLDGVRAYWDGQHLLSRQGNRFVAPDWFTHDFPDTPLDGELWIARNAFERVVSTVRKLHPIDEEWRAVGYYIFELPGSDGDFSQRIRSMRQIVENSGNPHLRMVEQFRVRDQQALLNKLTEVVDGGGEGLMLHAQDAHYHTGRSDALLKLKPYQDAEAIVIAHLPGKGRHKGRMGALLVETPNAVRFRIGTGFTDHQRDNPPPVGSTVTYKYYGLTRNRVPKFASFLRVRVAE